MFIFLSLEHKYKFWKSGITLNRQLLCRIICISLQKKDYGLSTPGCENHCCKCQNCQTQVYKRNTHLPISLKSTEKMLNVKTWKLRLWEVWKFFMQFIQWASLCFFPVQQLGLNNVRQRLTLGKSCPLGGCGVGVFCCCVKWTTCLGFYVC